MTVLIERDAEELPLDGRARRHPRRTPTRCSSLLDSRRREAAAR